MPLPHGGDLQQATLSPVRSRVHANLNHLWVAKFLVNPDQVIRGQHVDELIPPVKIARKAQIGRWRGRMPHSIEHPIHVAQILNAGLAD